MLKISLGISSCLLGEQVRYDGGHRLERYITDTLGPYLKFVAVCPEVECGLGVPREPMRLAGRPEAPRLVTVRTRQDLTERLLTWAARRVQELAPADLWGYIFKSKSPSCGPARVKVHNDRGAPAGQSAGLFARTFMVRFPLLPVIDEVRLHDPDLRDNFLERLFFQRRWRELLAKQPAPDDLAAFHSRHKLQILAHSPGHFRQMGKLAALAGDLDWAGVLAAYQDLALAALHLKATAAKKANVLYHLMGYFKRQLSGGEKQELLEIIEAYRRGEAPLVVAVALINHYARKYEVTYLREQSYLHPHPLELRLRNHA